MEFGGRPDDCDLTNYMVKATVLRVFVTQNKLESDAKTQESKDGTPGENTGGLLAPSGRSEASSRENVADDLATLLSDTHIY